MKKEMNTSGLLWLLLIILLPIILLLWIIF